jgi:hypothetical protein
MTNHRGDQAFSKKGTQTPQVPDSVQHIACNVLTRNFSQGRMNYLYLFAVLLSNIFALTNTFGGDGDLGFTIGSSAASKLVRNAVDGQLRQPRLMQIDVNSANDPWFNEVARLDSRNRIAIGLFIY